MAALALAAPRGDRLGPCRVVVACATPLDVASGSRETLCALAGPRLLVAEATRPPPARSLAARWLSLLESHHEPDAIARVPELLALARRLAARRLRADHAGGRHRAAGRRARRRPRGEDAIVAVGLGPKPPWVYPYTDHAPGTSAIRRASSRSARRRGQADSLASSEHAAREAAHRSCSVTRRALMTRALVRAPAYRERSNPYMYCIDPCPIIASKSIIRSLKREAPEACHRGRHSPGEIRRKRCAGRGQAVDNPVGNKWIKKVIVPAFSVACNPIHRK